MTPDIGMKVKIIEQPGSPYHESLTDVIGAIGTIVATSDYYVRLPDGSCRWMQEFNFELVEDQKDDI